MDQINRLLDKEKNNQLEVEDILNLVKGYQKSTNETVEAIKILRGLQLCWRKRKIDNGQKIDNQSG